MGDDPSRLFPSDFWADLEEDRDLSKLADSPRTGPGAADPTDLEGVEAMTRRLTARYVEERPFHEGGMGKLAEVEDHLLGRTVVRKRPRDECRSEAGFRAFVHEAQVTASLSHPAIVPLYDLQYDEQGYSYLMPRIIGVSLDEVLRRIVARERGALQRFGLPRLLGVFRTVCGAMAHAHERSVAHRDLKPDQIMLGEHDEVLVVDWGLAARFGVPIDEMKGGAGGSLGMGSIRSGQTVLEGIAGSPRYLPPERLGSGPIPATAAQDVFALGAILHAVLTLEPPVGSMRDDEEGPQYIERILAEIRAVRPPSDRRWSDAVDPEWDRICLRCLAWEPGDRFANGGELYRAVVRALSDLEERERRRAQATRCLTDASAAVARLEEARRHLFAAREMRRKLADEIPPQAPASAKRPLWEIEAEEAALERTVEEHFAGAERDYERALDHDRNCGDAREALADLHRDRLVQAEAEGRRAAVAYHRARLERFDDGRRVAELERGGTLIIRPCPESAEVRVARLREKDRRLVPGSWRDLDSPGTDAELSPGRFLLEVRADGRATARYALRVDRGSYTTLSPRLPRNEDLPEGFAYLPAGPCLVGGDPWVPDAGPLQRVDVSDLALAILPVTMADYREFIAALPPSEADARVPRDAVDGIPMWRKEGEAWVIPDQDPQGDPLGPDFPMLGILAEDAEAYARWLSAREGRPFRLPTRLEWEYGARGGDGRRFPWGDRFEPSYCWAAERQRGKPVPAPVGRCPEDISPAGVRDLAGGVGDWLADDHAGGGGLRSIGGGSWFANMRYCLLARRFGFDPLARSDGLGFRLALDLG